MEDLLNYLLYALLGHNVTSVHKNYNSSGKKSWVFCLEGAVYFVLDEDDLAVIHDMYEKRKEYNDVSEYARYMKIFETCV